MNDEEKRKNYELAERLISEENFAAAATVGAGATLLAAVAYGVVVAMQGNLYGFAAAGVGIFIGLSVGFLGRGISTKFGSLAAVYTVAGAVLGNLFRAMWELNAPHTTSLTDVFQNHSLSELAQRVSYNVSLVDLVYWLVALFCAVFLAKRSLSRAERLAVGLHKLRAER